MKKFLFLLCIYSFPLIHAMEDLEEQSDTVEQSEQIQLYANETIHLLSCLWVNNFSLPSIEPDLDQCKWTTKLYLLVKKIKLIKKSPDNVRGVLKSFHTALEKVHIQDPNAVYCDQIGLNNLMILGRLYELYEDLNFLPDKSHSVM